MATSAPVFGTGAFFSVTGSGTAADPYVLQLSGGTVVTVQFSSAFSAAFH
jgi:hypothetical protein